MKKYFSFALIFSVLLILEISCSNPDSPHESMVVNNNYSLLKSVSVSFRNIHCVYYTYSYTEWYPNPKEISEHTNSNYVLSIDAAINGSSVYDSSDNKLTISDGMTSIVFIIDEKNNNLSSVNFIKKQWYPNYLREFGESTQSFELSNVPCLNLSDREITIGLKGFRIGNYVNDVVFDNKFYTIHGDNTSGKEERIISLHPFPEEASLTIKITR